jgi:phosphoribosylformimino-5-aminoimidazole carboxamide ribotide isomerase
MVEVIPVLDIRGGISVCGKSGLRESYSPLNSIFSSDADPIVIAKSLPFDRLYVADLDGIEQENPDVKTLKLISESRRVMIDLGVKKIGDLTVFHELNSDIILGTETIENANVIHEALRLFGDRVLVSIDVKEGRVLSRFLSVDPKEAYYFLVENGVKRIIFLNISAVGTEKSDFDFINNLNKTGEILLGGGITKKDLEYMERIKVDGVLVGTALHKGLWM